MFEPSVPCTVAFPLHQVNVRDDQKQRLQSGSGPVDSASYSVSRPNPVLAGSFLPQRLNAAPHTRIQPITPYEQAPSSRDHAHRSSLPLSVSQGKDAPETSARRLSCDYIRTASSHNNTTMSPNLHLSYIAFLHTLLFTAATANPASIWHVSIWEAPAPPPGKGPPIAASSLRDLSYLPAQISAIAGAYVFSILVIGTAIVLVGRRLRRAAQASPRTLAMEMMKPVKPNVSKAFDPSPISPATNNGLYGPSPQSAVDMKNVWPSPNLNKSPNMSVRNSGWGSISRGHKKQAPSIQSSVITFDESVIEDDKEKNQKEMERLYAAVLEHDEKKTTSVAGFGDEQQHPPELAHLRTSQAVSTAPPRSGTKSPARTATKSPRVSSRPTPLSLHSRNSSRSSLGSFGKRRRNHSLTISPPMGSPDLMPDYNDHYGETEPLSPRIYDDPGPPPPTPPQRQAIRSREELLDSTRLSPRSTQFREAAVRTPRTSIPAIPAVSTIPESHPSRPTFVSRNSDKSASGRDLTRPKKAPAPLAIRTQAITNPGPSSEDSFQQLPLRSAPLPLRSQHPANYNSDRPPSMIKATVLERPAPKISVRTPRTGVPMTGVPMTPYSPYMPMTPLTPMTPSRLVTRQERKRREKEEGRRVATIDDAVEEEADTWGDAYGS